MRYDADGHRIELVTRPNGGSDAVITFRYQDGALAQELTGGTVTRTYVTDDTGAVVKFCDPDCSGSNPQYMPTWNGHGDAMAVWRIESTGTLTLANSYTYSTWGSPSTATANGYGDLGFRFLYVGRSGVAYDNAFSLGLLLMGARSYSPTTGRFLQPDPAAADVNLYAYAGNNPTTAADPLGTFWYRVRHGDTFRSLSVRFWGSPSHASEIIADNVKLGMLSRRRVTLRVGDCLEIYAWQRWSHSDPTCQQWYGTPVPPRVTSSCSIGQRLRLLGAGGALVLGGSTLTALSAAGFAFALDGPLKSGFLALYERGEIVARVGSIGSVGVGFLGWGFGLMGSAAFGSC